jgi:hypothetical protein
VTTPYPTPHPWGPYGTEIECADCTGWEPVEAIGLVALVGLVVVGLVVAPEVTVPGLIFGGAAAATA